MPISEERQQEVSVSNMENSLPETDGLHGLNKYLVKEEVTKAEILWCLQCTHSHISTNAAGNSTEIFPKMFPDSKIAANMQLSRSKISYAVVFGLGPYFHDCTKKEIDESEFFVACFDESLNKFAQKQQMDIAIRFWSKNSNEVHTRYYSSAFLGRTTANDLLEAFISEVEPLDLKRLLHVSMDGPNVNFKFHKELDDYLLSIHDEEDPRILSMGSCGLHVANNGFKKGVNSTGWNIVQFLRSAFNVFKDVPARRSIYTLYSTSTLFPLKFASTRWLESRAAAERALAILPNLEKFVSGLKKEKKEPDSNSYRMLVEGLNDKLLRPKLAFFSYVANLVEPFLTEYQSNAPLAPFLYTDLTILMTDLMAIFIKKEVLQKASNVYKIDVEEKENHVLAQHIKLGFSVQAELKKASTNSDVSEKDRCIFKNQCKVMLIKFCQKLLERSPLKYKLCKAITFCDPLLLVEHQDICIRRMQMAFALFIEKRRISTRDCDVIEKEFKTLINKPSVKEIMKNFDRKKERLDHFWRKIWIDNDSSKLLINFLKKVLLISHGNAFVERGFSVNKEVVVENQKPKSLVAQRRIYDGIQIVGGVENVEITKNMILKFRSARKEYAEHLEQQKKENEEKGKENSKKRQISEQVEELKEKKRKILTEKQKEVDVIDDEIRDLIAKR